MVPSLLLTLAALTLQPPAPPPKPDEPKPETAGEVLARVAANHPDVRVAEAKLAEAQAALTQTRLKATIELIANQGKLDAAKADVKSKQIKYDNVVKLRKSNVISDNEVVLAQADLDAAKAALTVAQATIDATNQASPRGISLQTPDRPLVWDGRSDSRLPWGNHLDFSWPSNPTAKPTAEAKTLRDILTKKVKFSLTAGEVGKGNPPSEIAILLEEWRQKWGFADAGLIIRTPNLISGVKDGGHRHGPPVMRLVDGENTVGAWLMLMLDELNTQQEALPEAIRGKYQFFVRDYGLLLTLAKNGPDEAPTLAEFLRVTPRPGPKK
jgi:hypothetical protein